MEQHFDAILGWGEQSILHLPPVSVIVIVDVLSFSTSVEIACARGAHVYPWRYRDSSAGQFAKEISAHLAVPRNETSSEQPFSLSPSSMQKFSERERLVLPSPNGATLSLLAEEKAPIVLAGCLRNASAVAEYALKAGGDIAVLAAGERWEDDSIRFAYEDLIGAGAILSRLTALRSSPDALAAVDAFQSAMPHLKERLLQCESGHELTQRGYEQDILLAASLNESRAVPHLMRRDGGASYGLLQ